MQIAWIGCDRLTDNLPPAAVGEIACAGSAGLLGSVPAFAGGALSWTAGLKVR